MMFHADLGGISTVIPTHHHQVAHPTTHQPQNEEKPFRCTECHRGFTQKVHLKTHLMQHSGEKPFACEVCGRGFIQKVHLKTHMGLHIDQKIHPCAICGEEFSLKDLLSVHALVHAIDSPLTCIICKKEFNQKIHLDAHVSIHCREKPYICTQCGKGFIQKGHLKTHMMVHTGEKPYSCTQCGKGFTQKVHLHTHLAVHSGIKEFKCTVCDKEFTQRGNLDRHLRIHSGIRPFKCAICSVSFTQKANLKSHMVVHAFKKTKNADGESTTTLNEIYYAHESLLLPTEVKLYRCNVCSKAFTRNGNLKTHMSVHSGDRPYQCSVCQKRFTQNVHLKKHMGVHTGPDGLKSDCGGQYDDGHKSSQYSIGKQSPYFVKEEPRPGIKNEASPDDTDICPNVGGNSSPNDDGQNYSDKQSCHSNSVINSQVGDQIIASATAAAMRNTPSEQIIGNNVVIRGQPNDQVPVNSIGGRGHDSEINAANAMAIRNQNEHAPPNSMRNQDHNPSNSLAGRSHEHHVNSMAAMNMNIRSQANEIAMANAMAVRTQAGGQLGAMNTLGVRGQNNDLLAANIMGVRNPSIGQVTMNSMGVRGLPGDHVPPNLMGVRAQVSEPIGVSASDKIVSSSKDINALNKRLLINSYVSPFPTYHYHNPIVLATREEGNKYDDNNVDILG